MEDLAAELLASLGSTKYSIGTLTRILNEDSIERLNLDEIKKMLKHLQSTRVMLRDINRNQNKAALARCLSNCIDFVLGGMSSGGEDGTDSDTTPPAAVKAMNPNKLKGPVVISQQQRPHISQKDILDQQRHGGSHKHIGQSLLQDQLRSAIKRSVYGELVSQPGITGKEIVETLRQYSDEDTNIDVDTVLFQIISNREKVIILYTTFTVVSISYGFISLFRFCHKASSSFIFILFYFLM